MNYAVLFIVFVVAFCGGVIILNQVRKNKNTKAVVKVTPQIKQSETAPIKTPIPMKAIRTGATASKPIICYECITDRLNQPQEPEEGQELEPMGTVKVFDSWIPYAAHILKSHPNSTRVQWAIDCVKDEMERLKNENLEYPEHLKTLIELINSHGQTPEEIDVVVNYNQFVETQSTGNKTQKIQVIDNWAERLGEINKPSDNNTELKEPEKTNKDWMEYT